MNSIKVMYRNLMWFAKPHIHWLFLAIAGLIFIVFIEMFVAYSINNMINEALTSDNQNMLLRYALILFAIIILGGAGKYVVKSSNEKFGALTIGNLKKQLSQTIQRMTIDSLETKHSGELASKFTMDVGEVDNFVKRNMADLMYQPFVFLVSSVFFIYLNWQLYVVGVVVIPLFLKIADAITAPLKKNNEEIQKHFGQMNSVLMETINGATIIKSFNQQEQQLAKFDTMLQQTLHKSMKMEKRLSFIPPLQLVLQAVPYGLCILFGGYLSVNEQISPSELLTCIYLMQFLVGPAVRIPSLFMGFKTTLASIARIEEILTAPREPSNESSLREQETHYAVEFDRVSFGYPDKPLLFENLSFRVEKNQTVALVGASGCGKSSILKLICGLYTLKSGEIRINGNPLSDTNLDEIRSLMAIVSQETFLFPETVMQNIAYGRLDASVDEIVEAAKAANAHEFISNLPEQYLTPVVEKGGNLSGGQKQRINIARALLKEAPVLLLDEPTSALDQQSEALIHESLTRIFKNRTVLVVAHRLSTIMNADNILVLGEGGIIAQGTHLYLMENSCEYFELYNKQFQVSI
ncbi:ABC transporter ATP-binding protein [Paenibacillus sp. SYP-B4298]|uniref:ABC transporter ATP-binding protein n=1 Tax=Paenibacillus sp. SYP-B4298 TaxID=2996034 RepID=UPI0022DCFB7C|nr:ABC transporter ATP-binding protein [Paenibacillus sp. SYP-B4298]